eukprot:g8755.t1
MSDARVHWTKARKHNKNAPDAIRVVAKETFNGSGLRKQLAFYVGDEIVVTGKCDEKGWNADDIPRDELGLPIPIEDGDGKTWYIGEVVKRTGKSGKNNAMTNQDDGQRFHIFDQKHKDAVLCVAYHEPTKTLITGSADGTIRQWNSDTSTQVTQFEGHPGVSVSKIFYDSAVNILVSVASTSAKIWNVTPSINIDEMEAKVRSMKHTVDKPVKEFRGHNDKILDCRFDKKNHILFTSAGDYDKTCKQWDCKKKTMVRMYERHDSAINNIDFDSDHDILVTCSKKDYRANVWNTQTGDHVQVLRGWNFESCAIAVDAGSNEVFVGGDNSSVIMFNMTSGEIKIRFNANIGHINKMIHFRDLNQLALAGHNNDAILMDDATGEEIRRFQGHTGPIIDVLYAPDTNSLFTASADACAKCWNVKTGEEISHYDGHKFEILCMAYDENTHGLVTGSRDKSARLWYWRNGVGPENADEQLIEAVLGDEGFEGYQDFLAGHFPAKYVEICKEQYIEKDNMDIKVIVQAKIRKHWHTGDSYFPGDYILVEAEDGEVLQYVCQVELENTSIHPTKDEGSWYKMQNIKSPASTNGKKDLILDDEKDPILIDEKDPIFDDEKDPILDDESARGESVTKEEESPIAEVATTHKEFTALEELPSNENVVSNENTASVKSVGSRKKSSTKTSKTSKTSTFEEILHPSHWFHSHDHYKCLYPFRVIANENYKGLHKKKEISFKTGDIIEVSGQCDANGRNAQDVPRIPTKMHNGIVDVKYPVYPNESLIEDTFWIGRVMKFNPDSSHYAMTHDTGHFPVKYVSLIKREGMKSNSKGADNSSGKKNAHITARMNSSKQMLEKRGALRATFTNKSNLSFTYRTVKPHNADSVFTVVESVDDGGEADLSHIEPFFLVSKIGDENVEMKSHADIERIINDCEFPIEISFIHPSNDKHPQNHLHHHKSMEHVVNIEAKTFDTLGITLEYVLDTIRSDSIGHMFVSSSEHLQLTDFVLSRINFHSVMEGGVSEDDISRLLTDPNEPKISLSFLSPLHPSYPKRTKLEGSAKKREEAQLMAQKSKEKKAKGQTRNKFSSKNNNISFVDKIFEKYDTDGNGSISKEELLDMINTLVKSSDLDRSTLPRQDDIDQVFLRLDHDRSGAIEKNEFETWISNGVKMSKEQRDKFRSKNDFTARFSNFLDCIVKSMQLPKVALETLFQRYDYYEENKLDVLALEDLVDFLCSETGTILDHTKISKIAQVILSSQIRKRYGKSRDQVTIPDMIEWTNSWFIKIRVWNSAAQREFAAESESNKLLLDYTKAIAALLIPSHEVHAKGKDHVGGDATHDRYIVEFGSGPLGLGLGVPEGDEHGCVVTIVTPDSQASETGLISEGDHVLVVGGTDVNHLNHYETIEVLRKSKRPLEIMFERITEKEVEKHSTISNDEMHNILMAYFISYDEDKIDHIDSLIEHFQGRFHTLAKKLERRYGAPLDIDDHKTDHIALAHFHKAQEKLHNEVVTSIALRKTKDEANRAKMIERQKVKMEKRRRQEYFADRVRIESDRERLIREVDLEFNMTWGPIEPDRFSKSLFRNMGRGLSPRTQRIKAMHTW